MSSKYLGKLITLDGPDGSGKSSNVPILSEHLRSRGYQVICTREPGGWGVPTAELLRKTVLENKFSSRAELLLMAAARCEHMEKLILPELKKGNIVISDRFSDSSYAYQCRGRGLPEADVLWMEKYALGDFEPDYTLFFDLPIVESQRRMALRPEQQNHLDREEDDFRQRVYDGYQHRFLANPRRMVRIDALPEAKTVAEQMLAWANAVFENKT